MDRTDKQNVAAVLRHAANVLEASVSARPTKEIPYSKAEVLTPPYDDLDPEFAAVVNLEFQLTGQLLAQLLGKQQRAMPKVLEQLKKKGSPKQLFNLLYKSTPAIRVIKRTLTPAVAGSLREMAEDNFERDARLREWDWAPNQEYSSTATVRDNGILFSVDVDALGRWM